MNKPFQIIGLTGPSGAGKSIVAEAFAACGVPSVDTDRVYHDLLIPPSPCLDEICAAFSPAILRTDGTLNRRALAETVFADTPEGKERLATLNRITHRYIKEKSLAILREWEAEGKCAGILDAPLLIEAGMVPLCSYIVAVLADPGTRKKRLLTRDGLTEAEIDRRLAAQKPDSWYESAADTVIYNNGTPEAVTEAVRALCLRLGVAV